MSGVSIEFVGGPLDGQQRVMLFADPMDPALSLEVETASLGVLPPIVKHRYEREPSTRDDGPLWLYRWAGEQS